MRSVKYKDQADWFAKNGFNEDGITYVVTGGNTFEAKDMLKFLGCKYSSLLKWHSPEDLVIDGFKLVQFSFKELYFWIPEDGNVVARLDVQEIVKKKLEPFINKKVTLASALTNTEWVGEIGDRLRKVPVEIVGKREITNQNGSFTLFTFEYGNAVLCWFTSVTKFEQIGDKVLLSATVKDHRVYEGQKQTYVNRCLMYPIE